MLLIEQELHLGQGMAPGVPLQAVLVCAKMHFQPDK